MKVWKKIIFVVMTILLLNLTIVSSYERAQASIVSKPLTIAAKKVAKDLAKDSAVAMAEHIAFEKMMKDFLEADLSKVDEGFVPVCLDGAKSYEQCSPNKRAQIKENLTSNDKSLLTNTVENVLEQKTNTSTKWQKFLDFFVPIFLLSGLVATFDALLNRDSQSFIDEIAQQALIDAGLLKPLGQEEVSNIPVYDFASVISKSVVTVSGYHFYPVVTITNTLKSGASVTINTSQGAITYSAARDGNYFVGLNFSGGYGLLTDVSKYFPYADLNSSFFGNRDSTKTYSGDVRLWSNTGEMFDEVNDAANFAGTWIRETIIPQFEALQGDVNGLNSLHAYYASQVDELSYSLEKVVPNPVPNEVDYGVPSGGLDNIRNPDGTVPVRGIDSFTFTIDGLPIYPSPDSVSGWRDRTTGEEIPVIDEEEIIVEEKIPTPDGETDPDGEENPLACARNLKNIEFKRVGTAFTNAFPFSIPWDIKRFIDNALVGVGSEKPSFNLSFLGDGVTLEIPSYFDNWLPFVHGLIIILFDVSLVYLFYRFMKGGGD